MIYRIAQGLRALAALFRPIDLAAAAGILSPPLLALFNRMRRDEQLHSLRVMQILRDRGQDHPDLLTAALLHDCGKSRHPYTLFERTLVVLAKRVAPAAIRRWSEGEPRGWKRPFVIAANHPQWSAEDMDAAGASPLAVALARRHQVRLTGGTASEEDRLLKLLQAADNDS